MGAVIAAATKIRKQNEAASILHRAALEAACGDANIGAQLVDEARINDHGLEAAVFESNRVFEVEVEIIARSVDLARPLTLEEAQALNAASHAAVYPPAEPGRGLLDRLRGR
jgi:hypothetical protein